MVNEVLQISLQAIGYRQAFSKPDHSTCVRLQTTLDNALYRLEYLKGSVGSDQGLSKRSTHTIRHRGNK